MSEKYYCNPCTERIFLNKPEASAVAMSNTSGQGKFADIPNEIKGWSWGAFFFCWIWGIFNRVWIALFCLIPYVGVVMQFIVGVKGNEWAWQSKKWDSIEHFKKTQRKWALWVVIGLAIITPVVLWQISWIVKNLR